MDDCGRTSATSRPSTTPSPPSTRPSDARGRRSSAFVRERHAPIDARGRTALSGSAGCVRSPGVSLWSPMHLLPFSRLARRLPTGAFQPPPGKTGPLMRTVIAIALGAALGPGGFALAQHDKHGDAAKVKSLLEQDVSERIDGKEARVSVLGVPDGPGASTPPHRHPGAVFGHVLEGELEAQLEGQPLRKLKAGDTFYEPTMALHSVSRNPSKTANTRLLAVILHPRDAKELAILEKPKH